MKPECRIFLDGTKCWWLNGKLHREDGPAIEHASGTKWWYLNGKYHREDGPAIEHADGTKYWYLNGRLHREDGPAIEWADGSKEWYLFGRKLHISSVTELKKALKLALIEQVQES